MLVLAFVFASPQDSDAAASPRDFVVNIDGGPAIDPVIPTPTGMTPPPGCEMIGGLPPTQVRCPVAYHLQQDAMILSGTATDSSTGLTGTMSVTCDIDANLNLTVLISLASNAISYEAFSGTGTQECRWQLSFGSTDSLTGVLDGTMAMALDATTPNTVVWTGTFDVTLMGGSGVYAGLNGSGTFEQSETIPLQTSNQQALSRSARAYVAAPDASAMHLALQAGKPKVQILAPRRNAKLPVKSREKISVFTAPGATCAFTARRKGMRARKLGTVNDGKTADGRMSSKARFARTLGRGQWTLTASCAVGKNTGTASVNVKIG